MTTVLNRSATPYSAACFTVSASPSALISAATTRPPSARIRNTIARPIPDPAPVISTRRSAKRSIANSPRIDPNSHLARYADMARHDTMASRQLGLPRSPPGERRRSAPTNPRPFPPPHPGRTPKSRNPPGHSPHRRPPLRHPRHRRRNRRPNSRRIRHSPPHLLPLRRHQGRSSRTHARRRCPPLASRSSRRYPPPPDLP